MGTEAVPDSARFALTFYQAYVQAAAEEMGMERALQLHAKVFETAGAQHGQTLKDKAGSKEVDIKAALALLKTAPESLGIDMEVIEEGPQKLVLKCGKCSIYESAQTLGLAPDAIETLCRRGPAAAMDAAAKQLNPGLSFRVARFRSAPDETCTEELVLGQP